MKPIATANYNFEKLINDGCVYVDKTDMLWKQAGELAKAVGGHGGMDFLMDLRWAYCLQNGLPLDMDVYDLATWCSICELSERSVRSGSKPQDVPDFTRGGWKTAKPLGIEGVDLSRLDFDRLNVS